MIKAIEHTTKYLQAPEQGFWQWADKTEVIEWANGGTICYRDDLIEVLQEYSDNGVPRLGSILLIMAACQVRFGLLHKAILSEPVKGNKDSFLNTLLHNTYLCLQAISSLPNDLKKGNARSLLIMEIFQHANIIFGQIPLKHAVEELISGRLDPFLVQKQKALTKEEYISELLPFGEALKEFRTTERLATKLRTGVYENPGAVPIPLTETAKAALLESLAQDDQTMVIAQLARKLISVINIPMHSQISGEHSFGGITDISNRGSYDRLLISELAQEDTLLMARLVNNEALYFQREEPPDQPKRKRTLLLDTSLKMWGVPRVFALSAALAFAHLSKHGEFIEAYTLNGEQYLPVDLSDKEGIVAAMGHLNHALNSGKALISLMTDLPDSDANEYILFTDATLVRQAEFHAHLQQVIHELRFIVTVDRSGELQVFNCNNGRTQLLNNVRINLDDLFEKPLNFPQQKIKNGGLPAFLTYQESPLLFPKVRIKFAMDKMHVMSSGTIVTVTENQRLLLMTTREKGATEILDYIENGLYFFGSYLDNAYLLVNNAQHKLTKLYIINLVDLRVDFYNIPEVTGRIRNSSFAGPDLHISTDYSSLIFSCKELKITWTGTAGQHDKVVHEEKNRQRVPSYLAAGSSIGSYSVMYRMRNVFISEEHVLVFGSFYLSLEKNNQVIRVREMIQKQTPAHSSQIIQNEIKLLPNKKIKFCKRAWADGSVAITDSRGLLHLKSSDETLPEITIVMVSGSDTSCWAADGKFCGVPYFINENFGKILTCEDFYQTYIQRFIDQIEKYETPAAI